ncbi:MAG: DUF4870 domain-containing protein [Chloroflexi bacterium]|nr:DUF4870 domain-containing protein [Chloroflexota bacterium]
MNDQDHTTNQGIDDNVPVDQNDGGEGVPVPSRIRNAVENLGQPGGDDVVREYEDRYYGGGSRRSRLEDPPPSDPAGKQRTASPPLVYPRKAKRTADDVSSNERKWAALAHGSTVLTLLLAVPTAGLGALVTMFVPFLIYLSFRKRSEYVAFQALQAFATQLVATVGLVALLLVGTAIFLALVLISIPLMFVLIGFLLLLIVVLAYTLFVLATLALPLGAIIYSVIAVVETWSGNNYRIPYVARWVESQMYSSSGFLATN